MTIVVAIKESDSSLLLAGDTGAFEPSLNLRFDNMPKLFYHPKGILAWGYSGSPTIVDEDFTPWLKNSIWPPTDWRTFRNQTIDKFAELNGLQRRLATKAEAKDRDNNVADLLLLGWIDTPELYLFGADGNAQSHLRAGFLSIGSGALHAVTAYKALVNENVPNLSILTKLQITMDTVLRTAVGCEFPYNIWRLKKDGIWMGLERGEEYAKKIEQ